LLPTSGNFIQQLNDRPYAFVVRSIKAVFHLLTEQVEPLSEFLRIPCSVWIDPKHILGLIEEQECSVAACYRPLSWQLKGLCNKSGLLLGGLFWNRILSSLYSENTAFW